MCPCYSDCFYPKIFTLRALISKASVVSGYALKFSRRIIPKLQTEVCYPDDQKQYVIFLMKLTGTIVSLLSFPFTRDYLVFILLCSSYSLTLTSQGAFGSGQQLSGYSRSIQLRNLVSFEILSYKGIYLGITTLIISCFYKPGCKLSCSKLILSFESLS